MHVAAEDDRVADREVGEAFAAIGAIGLACCVLGSIAALVVIGTAERPAAVTTDYVFRQRWTWANELAALFVAPFPAALVGLMLGRRAAERRAPLRLARSASWSRLSPFADRLVGLPMAGVIAGALLWAAVNPGPGLVSAAVTTNPRVQRQSGFEGVGAMLLTGATIGWLLALLATGAGLRRRAAREPTPVVDRGAVGRACVSIGAAGLAGCAVGAAIAWALFGLADRPLELVRDVAPPSIEQWDWLNKSRHVLVGSAIGLFAGLIGGRLLASRALRAAGLDGLPFGRLRDAWIPLVGAPLAGGIAAFVFYELQNPDRVFDATLPLVLGPLLGLALVLIPVGIRLRAFDQR